MHTQIRLIQKGQSDQGCQFAILSAPFRGLFELYSVLTKLFGVQIFRFYMVGV